MRQGGVARPHDFRSGYLASASAISRVAAAFLTKVTAVGVSGLFSEIADVCTDRPAGVATRRRCRYRCWLADALAW
jgi:hypothetical protein